MRPYWDAGRRSDCVSPNTEPNIPHGYRYCQGKFEDGGTRAPPVEDSSALEAVFNTEDTEITEKIGLSPSSKYKNRGNDNSGAEGIR